MIQHVQTLDSSMAIDGGTTQTRSVTWTTGNLGLIYSWGYVGSGSPNILSVVGSNSGTWTPAVIGSLNANRRGIIYYHQNITGGADTVTITWDSSLDAASVITASEYSGVAQTAALGDAQHGEGLGSPSTTASISLTDAHAGSLYVGFLHVLGTSTNSVTTSGGVQRSDRGTFLTSNIQDVVNGSGALSLTWGISSNFYSVVGATFKPASGGNMLLMF